MKKVTTTTTSNTPWNKGKITGQKPPLQLKDIWAIRIRLQMSHRVRELALFNLAIDSKLRACDLLALRLAGYSPRWASTEKSHDHPTKNKTPGSVRDKQTNS